MRRELLLAVVLVGCGLPPGANRDAGPRRYDVVPDGMHDPVLVGRWRSLTSPDQLREYRADGTGILWIERDVPCVADSYEFNWSTDGGMLQHALTSDCIFTRPTNCFSMFIECAARGDANLANLFGPFTWTLEGDAGETMQLTNERGVVTAHTRAP